MVPYALLFDGSKKSLYHSILFRRIGCDELLFESVGLGG